jgi:hypothetical protein
MKQNKTEQNGTEHKKELGRKQNTETENTKCCKKQDRSKPGTRKVCGSRGRVTRNGIRSNVTNVDIKKTWGENAVAG